jgi:hypothetical protein
VQLEIVSSEIMAAGAKIGPLAHADVLFDCDLSQTKDADILSDPNVILNG